MLLDLDRLRATPLCRDPFDYMIVDGFLRAEHVPALVADFPAISGHGSYPLEVLNHGSAFAGLNANTHWYNLSLSAAMLIGRFLMIVPMLAIAGSLAKKKLVPPSPGTFPVHTPLFTVLLVGVILIVGALTFFPALSLGPILEHLLMHAGKSF